MKADELKKLFEARGSGDYLDALVARRKNTKFASLVAAKTKKKKKA